MNKLKASILTYGPPGVVACLLSYYSVPFTLLGALLFLAVAIVWFMIADMIKNQKK